MTHETTTVMTYETVGDLMQVMGRAARDAAEVLALAPTEQKNRALRAAAAALRARRPEILAGNAVILRGGSESARSSAAIHACLGQGLEAAGLPRACIQLVPTTDRAAVGHMLSHMADSIDVIVPRGGKSLIARVQQEARAGHR